MKRIRSGNIKDGLTLIGLLLVYGFFEVVFFGWAYDSTFKGFIFRLKDPLVLIIGLILIAIALLIQKDQKKNLYEIQEQIYKLNEIEKFNFEYFTNSINELNGRKESDQTKKLEKEFKAHFRRNKEIELNFLMLKKSKINRSIEILGYSGLFLVTTSMFIYLFDRFLDWQF
jgi:hypothetical protein